MPDMIPGDERLLWDKVRLVERIIELEDLLACCDLAKRAREKALVMVAEGMGDIRIPTNDDTSGNATASLELEPDFMRYLVAISEDRVLFAGDPEIGKSDTEVQAELDRQGLDD